MWVTFIDFFFAWRYPQWVALVSSAAPLLQQSYSYILCLNLTAPTSVVAAMQCFSPSLVDLGVEGGQVLTCVLCMTTPSPYHTHMNNSNQAHGLCALVERTSNVDRPENESEGRPQYYVYYVAPQLAHVMCSSYTKSYFSFKVLANSNSSILSDCNALIREDFVGYSWEGGLCFSHNPSTSWR